MLGIKLDLSEFGQGSSGLEDDIDGITDAYDDATAAAKKFSTTTLGIDELNINSPQTDTSSGNNAVVGQKVGRRLWKINNLQWGGLDAETWVAMKEALEDFYVPVTFTGDDNKRHTIHMYPGDTTGKPLFLDGIFYKNHETCKFNLIDCGWEDD